jgi:hypothetical protein
MTARTSFQGLPIFPLKTPGHYVTSVSDLIDAGSIDDRVMKETEKRALNLAGC